MRKLIIKLSILLLVLFVGVSLSACTDKSDSDSYNKKPVYGDLSSETNYATLGNLSISEKELYDELRSTSYDYLLDELIKLMVPTTEYSVEKNREDLEKIALQKCYGTNEADKIEEMTAATKAKYELQFADQMALLGVNIKNAQGEIEVTGDACLKYFINELAQKDYVRNLLTTSNKYSVENEYQLDENGEKILDEDGKEISNPYYISEDAIASAFNSNENEDKKYNVVIVSYNTLADAQEAFKNYDVENLSLADFKELYYSRYSYKNVSDDNFLLSSDDLSKYNTTLSSLIKNINENFEEFATGKTYKVYQQFSGKIYAVYVISKYEASDVEFEDLTPEQVKETREEIVENKLTSSTISSLLFEKLYESKVVINDYVFDALYSVENENHTRLEANAWTNDFLASVDGNKITAREFYNAVEPILGISSAMDYFTAKTLLNSTDEYLTTVRDLVTSEDLEAIDKDYEEIMESFKNDELSSNGYPSVIGEDVFKFLYFGSTNESEIKEFYKSQKIWSYYVDYKSDAYFDLAVEFGKRYAGYKEAVEGSEETTEVSGKYFDLSVKHILLTVDYNGDGTADDPELYMKKLTAAQQSELTNAVAKAMVAIVEEVNYLVSEDMSTMLNALDFVLKQYNSNGHLEHSKDAEGNYTESWNDYKSSFNLGLTIEDLGSVNNSTVSSYVSEFGVGVQKLYNELKEKALLNEEYLYGEIIDEKLTEADQMSMIKEELIKTSYGYHILASYNSASITSAKYTEASDTEKQYSKILIKFNGKDQVIDNAYSNEIYASANQIKVYEAQINTDDGITSLPVGAKTFISKFYSDFKTKYTNSTFKNILFAYTYYVGEGKLDFASDANDADFAQFLEIQKRQFESYTTPEVNAISIFADWWTLVLPQ